MYKPRFPMSQPDMGNIMTATTSCGSKGQRDVGKTFQPRGCEITNHDGGEEDPFNEEHHDQVTEAVVVSGGLLVVVLLAPLDPVSDGGGPVAGDHELERKALGAASVVAA